jgi:replicative DNA helicase
MASPIFIDDVLSFSMAALRSAAEMLSREEA